MLVEPLVIGRGTVGAPSDRDVSRCPNLEIGSARDHGIDGRDDREPGRRGRWSWPVFGNHARDPRATYLLRNSVPSHLGIRTGSELVLECRRRQLESDDRAQTGDLLVEGPQGIDADKSASNLDAEPSQEGAP
jgi:hypothetical protein